MTTHAPHPDQLQPGDAVGPWRIVHVLGRGGSARVFKVERNGLFYAMKTYLLPLSGSRETLSEEEYVEEVNAYRRLAREAAALFTYASHPSLLRVHAVDCWPHPTTGYPYLIIDYVDGDDWHHWRWRRPCHAASLVNTFSDVVRTVGTLHAHGVYHRDLKAENILIRRQDGRPFIIDFGTVRLPGTLTQTIGLPEGVLHLLPPELLAFTRTEAWKMGVRFEGGVGVDLYALGVLLYQALTDLHPFSPELPDKELLAAIAQVPPRQPHLLNPLAPRSLCAIAMKLLEKQPEDRYPSTDELLHALETAAEKERHTPAWKVPLTPQEEGLGEESFEDRVDEWASNQKEASKAEEAPTPEGAPQQAQSRPTQAPPPGRGRKRWLLALGVGMVLGTFGLLLWRSTLGPSPAAPGAPALNQRGSTPVPSTPQDSPPRSSSLPRLLTAWLCAASGLGCPAAQVRPEPEDCSQEAKRNTFEVLKLNARSELVALIDVNQPGEPTEEGTYHDGRVVGRIMHPDWYGPGLPDGTLLYGRLWTGPGIQNQDGKDAVLGRYTEVLLPDGRRLPVCIVLGGPYEGRWVKRPGSRAGAALLDRAVPLSPVHRWP